MNNKKLLIRILVPVLIAVAVIVIWVIKTNPAPTPVSEDRKVAENEEFALDATAIDLDALKAYGLPIIIDFGADYCAPCREFYPVLETMNAEMQGKAIIKFVDTEKYSDIASAYPIQVIPTQVFFNSDGTPYVPSDSIDIDFTMYSSKDTNEHIYTVHEGGLTVDQMRAILEDMGVTQ